MIHFDKLLRNGDIICDECGTEKNFYAESFRGIVGDAMACGWWVEKDDETNKWYHYCTECRRKLKTYA